MIIRWDPRDAIFVVAVPELPGCYTHGRTYEEAVAHAIEGWIDVALQDGEEPPTPLFFEDSDFEIVGKVAANA